MTSGAILQPARPALTLSWLNVRGVSLQVALIAATIILPAVFHAVGAPVHWLLPMHWPVILAGLAYGPSAGLVVGLLAPPISLATSGMPPAPYVFIMMAELGIYGLAAGWLRGKAGWSVWLATAAALVCGRIVAIVISGVMAGSMAHVVASYGPGVPCAIAQIALLPPVVRWWVSRERGSKTGGRSV